ncbi:hypothetical protein CSUI_006822 [Cystoisospora suis]|uniref:Uncharacterized protein n=1 Tax=Cystoisospora suis TaxID=483139 RepID=A0A2C6KS73_9APIC|nr:hypothetical protein CSUI_006822 [Cystoisospora suis]
MNGFGENDSSPQGQEEDSWFRGGENEGEQGEEEEEKKKKTAKASSSYPSLREEEEEEEEKKKRKRYDDWLRRNLELEEGGYNIMKILYSYLVHSQGCATVDPAKLRKPPYGRVNTAAARPGGGYSSFGRAICERDENSIIDDSLGSKTQGDSSSSSPPPFLFGPAGRSVFMPVVHLPDDTTGSLVVINEKRLQLVLILTEDSRLVSDVAFLQHIRSFALEAGLADLEQVFGTEFDTIMKQEDAYRFIYFNHINHAVRVSNRACPSYAPSPPMYEGCPLTKQEVRRMAQMHRHLCVEPRRHRMDAFSTCDVPSPLCDKGSNRRLSVDPHTHTGPHEADHHTLTSTDSSKLSKEKVTSTHNEIRSPLQRASSPSRTSDELHSDLGSSRAGNRSSDSSPSRQELSGDVSGHRRHAASSNEHNGDDEHERAHRSSSPVKGTESGATTSGGNVRVKTRPAAIKLLAVKDGRCGWLLGSASMNREFYVALDDSKTTLTKAMEDGSRFEYMHFANIFV